MTAATRIELELTPSPEAAAAARIALDDLEDELAPALLKDVRLVVSELVTNSIRHAGAAHTDTIELRAWLYENCFRIEVSDCGPGFEPVVTAGRGEDIGGWGLYIVETLADRWDVAHDGDRTRVWFEIDMRPQTHDGRERSDASHAQRGRADRRSVERKSRAAAAPPDGVPDTPPPPCGERAAGGNGR